MNGRNSLAYSLNVIARWVVGLVFLFSSFVKGVDPMGTTFKVQEYMQVWSLGGITFDWALPLAGTLSTALICAEFVVGVLLIANAYRRLSAWSLLVLMSFFTVTTFFDALTNKVSDCGCFGDAIKLTNWQTFWKNIALDVPTVWIVLTRNLRRKRRFERDGLILIGAVAAMLLFELYNTRHEPVIDFRPWKKGNVVAVEKEAMNHMILKHKTTGEVKDVAYANGGWNEVPEEYRDFDVWEVLSSRTDSPVEIVPEGFGMTDLDGEDCAAEVLLSPDGVLVMTAYRLEKIDERGAASMRAAMAAAEENGYRALLLISALPEEVQAWLYEHSMAGLDYYFADDTAIKAMLRGNPGFMLLKQGVVTGKGRSVRGLGFE
ncbi:MAG: DoxX family protein [Bacteroidales bacterium]|nr:DoxX family protein [Bacteroidales bacterium]